MLTVDELERHPDFRGPEVVELGRRLARGGRLDATILGVHSDRVDPQLVKKVWHCIARFGDPAE